MVQKKILVPAGRVHIADADTVVREISSSPELQLGAYVKIIGPIRGVVLIMFPEKHALVFAVLLSRREPGTTKVLDELGVSAIAEACNILAGSYLKALGRECGLLLFHSTSRFTSSSTLGATQNITMVLGGAEMETVVLDASFNVQGEQMHGSFALFCESGVLDMISGGA